MECFRRAGIVAITVMTHDEGASQIALVLVATVISAYVTEIINPFAVGARPKPTVSTLNLFDKVKPGRVCGRGGSSVVDSLGGLNNIGSQLADIPGCNRGTSEDITATGILSLPGVSDCREREGGGMSDKADTNGDEVNSEGKDNEDDQPWVIAAHVGKNPDGGSSSDDAVTNGDEVKSEGKDNDEDEPWDITAHVGRNPGVAPFSSTGEIRDAVGNGGKNIDVASISDTDKVSCAVKEMYGVGRARGLHSLHGGVLAVLNVRLEPGYGWISSAHCRIYPLSSGGGGIGSREDGSSLNPRNLGIIQQRGFANAIPRI